MNLVEQIDADLKSAMLARDEVRKLTIRGIKKEIIEAKTAPGANGEVSDDTILKIVAKLLKQRKDSAAIYSEQGRVDLAENELAEAAVLETYMPKQMSAEELDAAIRDMIAQTGAQGPKDMGKVMGVATKKLAGKAEGRVISETVKRLLNA
ncbi:MAG: GatB/YqeY domain-containing protein [Bacteroidales bacterium]|nr:GatB/YqeY domain-containing protein [Bacteroidales bacterium]